MYKCKTGRLQASRFWIPKSTPSVVREGCETPPFYTK